MKTVRVTGFGDQADGLWQVPDDAIEKRDPETGLREITLLLKRQKWTEWKLGNPAITELLVIVNGQGVIMQCEMNAQLGEIRARAMWTASYSAEAPDRWQIFSQDGTQIDARVTVREALVKFGQTIYVNPRPGVGG